MKNITYVAFAALLTMAPSVNADLITVGNIQTNDNDGTSIMTDTITGTMYSRLDETLKLTFSELTEELKADGKWDGWSFATSIESERLINAMLGGVSECDGYTSSQVIKCGTLKEEWQDGSLGASIDDGNDYWLYQSSLA
jgi:hypothetical protein